MKVHKKLMDARLKLQSMELSKTGNNKFAGYKYFELGDFLPQIQKIFFDLSLCGIVSFTHDIAKLIITDIEDDSFIEITSPMGSAALKGVHEVQNIGAVETYQRRYLWVAAMEIVEHDALDAVTGSEQSASRPVPKVVQAVKAPMLQDAGLMPKALNAIRTAVTLAELKSSYTAAVALFGATAEIIAAKDQRKHELTPITESISSI